MKKYIFLVLLLIIGYNIAYFGSVKQEIITVKNKERITTGSGENISSKFIVYCKGEVFENTDNIFFGKFDSADVQNELEMGKTYVVKVAGWRMPFLSAYRNIINIEKEIK